LQKGHPAFELGFVRYDQDAGRVWLQITAAVEELQRERRPDEAVN
jgi:hypothetical protein